MEDRKRRRKTGCLTCRLRRVKCDEGRPTCQRCGAANIECAGYEEKRRLDIGKLNSGASKRLSSSSSPAVAVESQRPHTGGSLLDLNVQHRENGLPLVGLPVNPTQFQRPHARARDLLAYHQFVFRTLPVLFPSHHMFFWRDYLCEQCFDTEYVYDTITALGSMHRATLLLSQEDENDRNRGLDTKVIACQAYTRALQEFSNADKSTACFVGVIILCAYFEVIFLLSGLLIMDPLLINVVLCRKHPCNSSTLPHSQLLR
jgi:Fungal Zn(2)-Cys(6) binuclear cluster domain